MPNTISKINGYSLKDNVSGYTTTPIMNWYGTCTTSSATIQKDVVCEGFTLTKGAIIGIRFATPNTADTPTLNINNTGAKNINLTNGAPSASNPLKWTPPAMLYFMYTGGTYQFIAVTSMYDPAEGANTWYGTSDSAATSAAKTSTIDNFYPRKGALVSITFTNANTVEGTLTLNVNGTGANQIYYNGVVTSSSNPLLWDAGEQVTFILGSQSAGVKKYHFVCKSKSGGGDITLRKWS